MICHIQSPLRATNNGPPSTTRYHPLRHRLPENVTGREHDTESANACLFAFAVPGQCRERAKFGGEHFARFYRYLLMPRLDASGQDWKEPEVFQKWNYDGGWMTFE